MPKPSTRLVTATAAKTGSTTTAIVDGVLTTIQVARDLTVASGDVLFVSQYGSQWFAVARAYASAPGATDNDPVPDTTPGTVFGTLVVSPVLTGSWDGTRWRTDTDDVYEGVYGTGGNHTGAVFYGSKATSLAGGSVVSASIQVRRIARGSFNPTSKATIMRLITDLSQPVGAPTLTSTTAGPSLNIGQTASFDVPAAWAQALVDGTAGGLGFFDSDGSPFIAFAGRGNWTPAFTMTINWSR